MVSYRGVRRYDRLAAMGGPNRDGRSADAGLPKQWPAKDPRWPGSEWLGQGFRQCRGVAATTSCRWRSDGCQLPDMPGSRHGLVWSTGRPREIADRRVGISRGRAAPTVEGDLVFAVDQWGNSYARMPRTARNSGGRITSKISARRRGPTGDTRNHRWWTASWW